MNGVSVLSTKKCVNHTNRKMSHLPTQYNMCILFLFVDDDKIDRTTVTHILFKHIFTFKSHILIEMTF